MPWLQAPGVPAAYGDFNCSNAIRCLMVHQRDGFDGG